MPLPRNLRIYKFYEHETSFYEHEASLSSFVAPAPGMGVCMKIEVCRLMLMCYDFMRFDPRHGRPIC